MRWSECSTRVAGFCGLVLVLTLSGCGAIGGIIVGSVPSSHERREDDSFCTKRCTDLKGNDYVQCHKLCMSEQERWRSEKKAQWESDRKEWDRRLADEQLKIPQK